MKSPLVITANISYLKAVQKLSRKSPYTRDLPRFVNDYFHKGEVAVYLKQKELLGFVLVRHCSTRPYTSLYDLGVDPTAKRQGIGSALLDWVEKTTPHKEIHLVVDIQNESAWEFWKRKGFVEYNRKTTNSKHVLIEMVKKLKRKSLW